MAFLPIYDSSLWKHCSIYFLSIYSFFGFKFSMAKRSAVSCRIMKHFHFMFLLSFLQIFIFVMYVMFELRLPITTYRINIKNNNINIFKQEFKLLENSKINRSKTRIYGEQQNINNDIHFANKSFGRIESSKDNMVKIHRKWDMKPVVEISNVCINVVKEGKIKDVAITAHEQNELQKVKFCTVLRRNYPLVNA